MTEKEGIEPHFLDYPSHLHVNTFLKVYSAKFRGEDVAVKVLYESAINPERLAQFKQEVKIMCSVRSRYA
jgi:hypothetical protein